MLRIKQARQCAFTALAAMGVHVSYNSSTSRDIIMSYLARVNSFSENLASSETIALATTWSNI